MVLFVIGESWEVRRNKICFLDRDELLLSFIGFDRKVDDRNLRCSINKRKNLGEVQVI